MAPRELFGSQHLPRAQIREVILAYRLSPTPRRNVRVLQMFERALLQAASNQVAMGCGHTRRSAHIPMRGRDKQGNLAKVHNQKIFHHPLCKWCLGTVALRDGRTNRANNEDLPANAKGRSCAPSSAARANARTEPPSTTRWQTILVEATDRQSAIVIGLPDAIPLPLPCSRVASSKTVNHRK